MEQAGDQNTTERKDNDLESRVKQLEVENKRLKEEFDTQRAKFKELFLHKEDELLRKRKENLTLSQEIDRFKGELEETRSHISVTAELEVQKQNADAEIASLQRLVHETVEESSSSKSIFETETKKLQAQIQHLQNENTELKSERQSSPHHNSQEQTSLAPSVVISAVTKSLVRKLGADAFISQDSMEDSMRKVEGDDHAQEDAEVLRSLVVPLEEEIKALKDKLRTTDEQLQKYERLQSSAIGGEAAKSQHLFSTATNTSFEKPSELPPCDMCRNYETELVKEQQNVSDLELKVQAAEKAAERHREDLLKEIRFRKEIEEKWNEKREEHKQQVAELTRRTDCAEQDTKELHQLFNQSYAEIKKVLSGLVFDRRKIHHELEKLQKENDNLMGKYGLHSQQLQSEMIDLPNSVEELHETVLKTHQELIFAKIGKEKAEEQVNSLRSDIVLMKDQITNDLQERQSLENDLLGEITTMRVEKGRLENEIKQLQVSLEKMQKMEVTHSETLDQLDEIIRQKKELEESNNKLKLKVCSLQQEVDNGEAVQKDFIKLSQHLQIQLEKIRTSDEQVRWQHEEDVDECQTCKSVFSTSNRRKLHCRHCGHIFCINCLNHSVHSGPSNRASKVCDVCHTLLVKSSAPYFSTEVPHSPD